jgi:hypothetical protein
MSQVMPPLSLEACQRFPTTCAAAGLTVMYSVLPS